MGRKDNNIPYDSTEGKTFLQGRVSSFDKATQQAFWSFHDFLVQSKLAKKIEVRTKDALKNGTTVYHGRKAMLWVNVRTDEPKYLEIVFYTGLNNQKIFPGTRPCWFRNNLCGGDQFTLTSSTLTTAQQFAQQSAQIMDQEE